MRETQTDGPNAKDGVAAFFGRTSGTFGQGDGIRRFPHFGRRLVEVAGVPLGARVLDVATGRGAVLFPAAERVGPTGSVLGIDIAAGMIEATKAEVEDQGLQNVELRVMDAESLDLPAASFDLILCAFGLMFLPHLCQALDRFRRVLRPGGTLGVSTWAAGDSRFEWERELGRAYGIADRNAASLMVQRLNTAEELAAVLTTAGFGDVRVLSEVDERVHADAEEWWARNLLLSATRTALESLGPARMAAYQRDAFERLRPMAGLRGIKQRIEANFGLAQNP